MNLQKSQFVHYRFANPEGKISPRGGFTLCYIPEGDGCLVGISKCSISQNFSKKRGRSIAAQRATSSAISINGRINPNVHLEYDHQLGYKELNDIVKAVAWEEVATQIDRHGYDYSQLELLFPEVREEASA